MRKTESADELKPIPIKFVGTPITDETFIKQGWTRIDETEPDYFDDDEFYDDWDDDTGEFEGDIGDLFLPSGSLGNIEDIFFNMEPKYPNMDEWQDEYYFWVLKLPKDWPSDHVLTLISTTSDHHLPGMKKGEYIVELYNQFGLGTCQTEEELELLYKLLTGESIYK